MPSAYQRNWRGRCRREQGADIYTLHSKENALISEHFVLAFSADRAYHWGKDEVHILFVRHGEMK
jgi:hypothetical protein